MESNKASQDSLKPESQDSPGILPDDEADNSSQIMVNFKHEPLNAHLNRSFSLSLHLVSVFSIFIM